MFSLHHSSLFPLFLSALILFIDCLSAVKVTGALGGIDPSTGARPLRYEIHEFADSGPAFDVFILALTRFQAVDQSDPLSYFQLSGIHGYPRIPWDGVVGNGSYPGFCMHASTPFPVWHRPYTALFEQVLWEHAQVIASSYPDEQRDQYLNAALTLRLPYWDWAIYPDLPDVTSQPEITINTPSGRQTIENPLYTYVFQGNASSNGFPAGDPMAEFGATVRWWNTATQSSNQSSATAALRANAPAILSLTYQLLTSISNYTVFSCTWPGGQWVSANNIEAIHNSIHNSVGGFGHMQFPEVAGFDPIFWLHHASVDRLFAMWQALNPESYIEPTVNAYGSYYEPAGFVDSGSTTLAPFHSDDGTTLFTPTGAQSIKSFGYSYQELPDWQMTPSELAANVRSQVNALYNPTSNSTVNRKVEKLNPRSASIADSFGYVSLGMAQNMRVNNLNRQWSISVLVDRFSLNTSFCIDFFMGDPPPDVSAWATAKNLIGTYSQFISANVSMHHSHGFPSGQVQGEVSMTHILAAGVSRGIIRDLSSRSVVPVLRKALTWKARTPAGEEVSLASLSGLLISVSTRSVVPRTARDRFPVYGAVHWEGSATEGKPCGAPRPYRRE